MFISGSTLGSGSDLGSGSGSGLGLNTLFPFGLLEGDQLLQPADDGSSAPQSKLALSGITCPFFGVNESIIHVNAYNVLFLWHAELPVQGPDLEIWMKGSHTHNEWVHVN